MRSDNPNSLRDITDPEAFVRFQLRRLTLHLSDDEKEELVAEGLLILCELSNKYDATLPKDKEAGSFAGYANYLLPRRLLDAWHKHHPEHRYTTDPETGKRKWVYGKPPMSLDALLDNDGEGGADHHLANANSIGQAVSIANATRVT